MKLPISIIFIGSVLILAACSFQNIPNPITSPTPTTKPTAKVVPETKTIDTNNNQKKIAEAFKKYLNPKQATVRADDWTRVGKAYMQYDEKIDKTIFWLEIGDFDKPQVGGLTVYLIDNKQKEIKDQKLKIGDLIFDKNQNAKLYYEFSQKGNFYSYLKVVIEQGKEKVLEANFNPRLS